MNISIITIIYDGYGKFFDDWLKSILKQTVKPKEIVVVLSRAHNVKKEIPDKIDGIKIKVIHEPKRLSMGELRNLAIKAATSTWFISLDIDDILTPNAIEEMSKYSKKADAILLTYYKKFNGKRTVEHTPFPDVNKPKEWRTLYKKASGYVAYKRKFKHQIPLCVDSDFPNFPFLIQADMLGMKFVRTKKACAVYRKREMKSHSANITTEQRRKIVYKVIQRYAHYYYKLKHNKKI